MSGEDRDHDKCLHESDWAIMKDHVGEMKGDLKTVLKMLRGNGEPGIVTKLALQEQCLKKLHERLDDMEGEIKAMRSKVMTSLIAVIMLIVAAGLDHLLGG